MRDLAFLNVPRSHKVVQEVWRRSDAEGRQVDWLDVVQEWDWDLYLVERCSLGLRDVEVYEASKRKAFD
jgi:hypothetical protein